MASFQSKISWRRPRKGDNENYSSDLFLPTRPTIENSKKIATKLKKLKNIITASFQAKIGWKRLRKRENKNYHSISFLLDAL